MAGMLTMQYSARRARLFVHKPFTFCIRRNLGLRDSIVDGDWLPSTEWCQRYLPCWQPPVECRRKFGEVSFTECTRQRNDFELIPTVEIETRNPIYSYFGSKFPAICNYRGVMAA